MLINFLLGRRSWLPASSSAEIKAVKMGGTNRRKMR